MPDEEFFNPTLGLTMQKIEICRMRSKAYHSEKFCNNFPLLSKIICGLWARVISVLIFTIKIFTLFISWWHSQTFAILIPHYRLKLSLPSKCACIMIFVSFFFARSKDTQRWKYEGKTFNFTSVSGLQDLRTDRISLCACPWCKNGRRSGISFKYMKLLCMPPKNRTILCCYLFHLVIWKYPSWNKEYLRFLTGIQKRDGVVSGVATLWWHVGQIAKEKNYEVYTAHCMLSRIHKISF